MVVMSTKKKLISWRVLYVVLALEIKKEKSLFESLYIVLSCHAFSFDMVVVSCSDERHVFNFAQY